MFFSCRHNSTRHQLHVCMSQQLYTCLCIADVLFISPMAKLSHSDSAVCKVPYSLHVINVFQMTELLSRTFFFNEQETKHVSICLNEDLKPQGKTGTSLGYAVLIDIYCIILVTLKSNVSKKEVDELGNPRLTLSMYCGQYIRITIENTEVYLSKKNGHN